ncbi:hypothetical protein MCOR02_006544 [Pyricularia oryzae]|uniref:CFEM domain-containing protein n=1 Tax=Pyricularia grisea TaxID=148305 RepID=A0ABQ8NUP8_PYRGI|nr:hypothetical protein MCOR02_006544 [Pyricularia oryzae]KAI6302410.1 hypothetical protein MCOR33_002307 [Pyricularia grisea]KAI6254687.1 hypothetical protein MCOR19_008798 [Pyricularia oryzae]KAI6310093.1 hypothetical protein MCOR34_006516 [Pyricularia oryzae]KAI6355542.1 hypothetical protein MCOR32_010248 [Pyricularia oryzae]
MQLLFALFMAAVLVAAQSGSYGSNIDGLISQVPQCAFNCLAEAAESSSCGLTDIRCMCGRMSLVSGTSSTCLSKACSADQLATLSSTISKVCADVGAPDPAAAKTATSNDTVPAASAVPTPSQTAVATRLKLQMATVAMFAALSVNIV